MVKGIVLRIVVIAAVPVLVHAESIPMHPTAEQLLVRVAALEAQEAFAAEGAPACGVAVSTSAARLGEPFIVAWSSVGALDVGDDPAKALWPANGAAQIEVQTAGIWLYEFTFWSASGASTTCSTSVSVSR